MKEILESLLTLKGTRSAMKQFALGLAASAAVLAGSTQAATITATYDLGPQDGGTTIQAGVEGLIPWITKGTLPAGSILRSFSVNARLDSMAPGGDSWASDLSAYVDPKPEAPGTAALLQVGGYNKIGTVVTNKLGWGTGDASPPSPLVATKDVSALNIDLNTAQLSLGNGYSEATWSGTISVTYYGPASITAFGPGAVINDTARTIAWTVPFGTDLATLAPTITVSSGTCVPASGVAPNFAVNNPATYTVTEGATINTYTVTVIVAIGTSAGTTINVNLANVSGNTLNGTAYLAGGFAQAPVTYSGTTWNEATNSPATLTGLRDSQGNATSIGFTTASTTGAPDLAGPTTSPGAADVKLLKGCVYRVWNSGSGNTLNNRFTVSGLDPAKTYNIYLASAHNTPVKCSWRIGATGADRFIANTAATRTAETWVAGDDYVVFYKVAPDATGKILVYGKGLAGSDLESGLTLNGFQVVDATGFLSPENDMLSFTTPVGAGSISGTRISLVVPKGTDVTALVPTITVSSGATVSPNTGVANNFTYPQTYTVTAENGSTKVYTVRVFPIALPPVTDVARYFDASQLARLADNAPVTTWPDLSGHGDATVPGGNASPTYVANAGTASGLPALHFTPGSGAPTSGALRFTRDNAIRTVFSVFKGSSFLLTDADNYDFHRPTDNNPASPIWDSGYVHANIKAGSTYVNGALVDGTTDAMPTDLNNGFNLVEVLTDGNPVQADSFNKDRPYHSGDQYQAEVIIYDRVLTEAERVSVEQYLMSKWLGV
jgi:hypothetical protein